MSGGREVIIDVESTGFGYNTDDRIIEVACLEVFDGKRTGNLWQSYINPDGKKSCKGALKCHQIPDEFLLDKPFFHEIAYSLVNFIGDSTIISHNTSFDVNFILAELSRIGDTSLIRLSDNKRICTLKMARRRVDATGGNTITELCKRYGINTDGRKYGHGALVDCELLLKIYPHLKLEKMKVK